MVIAASTGHVPISENIKCDYDKSSFNAEVGNEALLPEQCLQGLSPHHLPPLPPLRPLTHEVKDDGFSSNLCTTKEDETAVSEEANVCEMNNSVPNDVCGREEHEEATAEKNWSSSDGYNQSEDATHLYDNTATQEVTDTNYWSSYDGQGHYEDGEHAEASADNYQPHDGYYNNEDATHLYDNPVKEEYVEGTEDNNLSSFDGYNQSEDATHMYVDPDSEKTVDANPDDTTAGSLQPETMEAFRDKDTVKDEHEKAMAENNWSPYDGYNQTEDDTQIKNDYLVTEEPEVTANNKDISSYDGYNYYGYGEYGEATAENNWSSYDGYNQTEDATNLYNDPITDQASGAEHNKDHTIVAGHPPPA